MDNVTQPITNMTPLGNRTIEAVKGNVEAIMASSHVWTYGCQAIGQTMAASAQAQLERNLSSWKAMTGVTSLKEAMDLHAHLARATVESVIVEAGKLASVSIEIAGRAMAPIRARITLAAEKSSPPTIQE